MKVEMQRPNPTLSILMPVDLLRRPSDLLHRVVKTAHYPGMEAFELVVAHNDRGGRHDRLLVRSLAELPHVKLVSGRFYDGHVNTAKLRNFAAKAASSSVILLLDADIYPHPSLFRESADRVSSGIDRVVMLPCLYLTKWASRQLERDRKSPERILNGYFSFERRYFSHLASPSSVLVLPKDDYWDVGGFDEIFDGHGYEDFDFMLRIALHHRLVRPTADLLENHTYRAPLLAEGFRKYLGRLSLQNVLDKKLVFHLFHFNDRRDGYFRAREENARKFADKYISLIREGDVSRPNERLLIDDFFSWCRARGVAASNYFVLFDARPGHVDRLSSWRDRLSYLLGWK